MPRTDLRVPFDEKDDAKRLGARWDPQNKVWFVPDGANPAPFDRWIPKAPAVNFRAPYYFVAKCPAYCWKCDVPIWVYGIALPPGHEHLDVDEDDDTPDSDSWVYTDEPAFLYYIDHLSPDTQARILALTSHWRVDYSKTTDSSYWMNHCEHCNAKQGDFQLFCEPESPFMPITESDAGAITLQRVPTPFEAHADGYSYDPEFFGDMKEG